MKLLIAATALAAGLAVSPALAQTVPAAPAAAPVPAPVDPAVRVVELEAELARERQIASNARFQVERLRAELREKDELIALARQRNKALFEKASEMLDRYEKMGFGDVISAREPFVQKGRVELENEIQAFEDALHNARFTRDTLAPSVEERMRRELGGQPGAADAKAPAAPAERPE